MALVNAWPSWIIIDAPRQYILVIIVIITYLQVRSRKCRDTAWRRKTWRSVRHTRSALEWVGDGAWLWAGPERDTVCRGPTPSLITLRQLLYHQLPSAAWVRHYSKYLVTLITTLALAAQIQINQSIIQSIIYLYQTNGPYQRRKKRNR